MKTLFNKIKPEYLEMLEQEKEKYPAAYDKCMMSLRGNEFIIQLTVDEAASLVRHTIGGGLDGIWEMFEI